ncbi:MAG: hypothetical protein A2V90_05535 [Gammaproteobacteria bacterium RBG_16_57_12]|nr:MAG: hypothetical protein A2V90_05535 [Gammaproteobacteria bacterium RBG_16_57_12]
MLAACLLLLAGCSGKAEGSKAAYDIAKVTSDAVASDASVSNSSVTEETPLQTMEVKLPEEPAMVVVETKAEQGKPAPKAAAPAASAPAAPVPKSTAAVPDKPVKKFIPKGVKDNGDRFVKLDAKGQALDASAKDWSCVWDRKLELTWEVKTETGLRARQHTYTYAGDAGQCQGSDCSVTAYPDVVNREAPCGISNWRLPTKVELQSIIYPNYRQGEASIDLDYFPRSQPGLYWTGSAFKYAGDRMWAYDFSTGFDYSRPKTMAAHLRLVSGELRPGSD